MQSFSANRATNSSDIATKESSIVEIPTLDPVWKLRWQSLSYRSGTWTEVKETSEELDSA